ncbi:MAG: hypothetical protein HN926_07735 [Chloroflexi bacterium]|nr:hypothetical protein [Chloroflexota bacterium]MBT4944107.1 hypothetical protein [Chloroflexota bacterium]MBT5475401.1 hypothetical protein [Chloroflexota bacterium]MBT5892529.1 hypothetical protein [Chloroflexota bacterium]MBT6706350.1 hypothetical protein [Chloroflexota bacterium]
MCTDIMLSKITLKNFGIISPLHSTRRILPLTALALFAVALTACGSGDDSESQINDFAKITPTEKIFSIEDFQKIRFKTSNEYDVEELTGVISAWNGFWTPSGTVAKEFEMRFYPSHTDAIELGTSLALEASGETALLDEEDATWLEGLKDRRAYFSAPSSHGSGTIQPMYGSYAIYGNMVLLCEGANEEQALEHCAAIMAAVDPIVAE